MRNKISTLFIPTASISNHYKLAFTGAILFITAAIVISSNRFYYDDEFFNLGLIKKFRLTELIPFINHNDVHPPLSYIINYIFQSDNIVLSCLPAIVLNTLALLFFYVSAIKRYSGALIPKSIFLLGLFLNGNILMWCIGLRWYSFWIPLFMILYTELLVKTKFSLFITVITSVLMIYTGYLSFIVLPVLFLFSYFKNKAWQPLNKYILAASVILLMSLYQIVLFFKYHIHGTSSQVSGLVSSLAGSITTTIIGNAVFPLEWTSILFVLVSVVLFIIYFFLLAPNKKNSKEVGLTLILILTFLTMLSLTGLGGKLRNSIFLNVLYIHLIFLMSLHLKKKLAVALLFTIALLTLHSNYNLITRTNTSKNGLNMPLADLKKILKREDSTFVVYTFEIETTYSCLNANYNVIAYHSAPGVITDTAYFLKKGGKIYLISTYKGYIDNQDFDKICAIYNGIRKNIKKIAAYNLGYDKWYSIKKKLDKNTEVKYSVQPFLIVLEEFEVTNSELKIPLLPTYTN